MVIKTQNKKTTTKTHAINYSGTNWNEVLVHGTTWMIPENMLEADHKKITYCMILCTWNIQDRQVRKNRRQISGYQWMEEGEKGSDYLFDGAWIFSYTGGKY